MGVITVVAAVIERDGLVLAARRAPGEYLVGYWEFPGGKVEPGESHEVALCRELREEFDIERSVNSLVGESIYDYGDKLVHLYAYLMGQ